jgi:hypothetical protein
MWPFKFAQAIRVARLAPRPSLGTPMASTAPAAAGRDLSLLLIATPAALVAVLFRRPAAARARVSLAGVAASAGACGVVVLPVAYLTDQMYVRHYAQIGPAGGVTRLWWPAVAIGLFGALLGPDRRWWPGRSRRWRCSSAWRRRSRLELSSSRLDASCAPGRGPHPSGPLALSFETGNTPVTGA